MDTQRHPKKTSPGLSELIGRALTDEKFRASLYDDRTKAIREYELTDTDLEALNRLSRSELDEHAARLGTGDASALAISIVIRIKF